MTSISKRNLFLSLFLFCCILCITPAAHAQYYNSPSISLHLGNGYTTPYINVSPAAFLLGQPVSATVEIDNLPYNSNAEVQCYVTNQGVIYTESASYNAFTSFTWTPSNVGSTTAACTLSYSENGGNNVDGYVGTENMPITIGESPTIYPLYKITSIIYAPPGNYSSDGYQSTSTTGSNDIISHNFQMGSSLNLTTGTNFLGTGASWSLTVAGSDSSGGGQANAQTISTTDGIMLGSTHTNPNAINHNQDLFLLWLNPAVSITVTGSTTASYGIGTQSESNNTSEPVDIVNVSAEAIEGNYQGMTTVPLAALVPQYDAATGNYDLPGVASICAHPLPVTQCTQANQCGCVPSDFSEILAQDPLLNYSTSESPLNADISGASTCMNPNGNTDCRYVRVMDVQAATQVTAQLEGPQCNTCDAITNIFDQSDVSQTVQSLSGSSSISVGYIMKTDVGLLDNGFSLSSATNFTWTDSESQGKITGTADQMHVVLSSSTQDCYEAIPIFEDTVYHTFVFVQPLGDPSCP